MQKTTRTRPTFRAALCESVECRLLFASAAASRSLAKQAFAALTSSPSDVVGYHNDLSSSGQQLAETQLTPSTVNTSQFQKQFATPVDGQVYAQPLYLSSVQITSGTQQGTHSVVYMATEHDSLYAIDSRGGNVLWKTSFLDTTNAVVNKLGAATITTVPQGDIISGDLVPEIGITSTPVIDRATGLLYLLAKTKQSFTGSSTPHYVQTLYEVNVQSGAVVRSTVIGDTGYSGGTYTYRTVDVGKGIDPYVVGTGSGAVTVGGQSRVYFNGLREFNRSGLVLNNGNVYIGFASHGDNGPYHGELLRYSTSTLALTGIINTTPNSGEGEGGIWMGGGIPAIDANGDLYVVTGNGAFDGAAIKNGSGQIIGTSGLNASGFPVNGNYGDAFLRISDDPTSTVSTQNKNGWGLKIADYFSPLNNQDLDARDGDLGSGGPMLLPASVGSAAHPNLLVGAGKDGTVYLIDRANMGHFDALTDHIVQEWGKTSTTGINGSLNTPAFYMTPGSTTQGTIYYFPGYGGDGRAYSISNAAMSNAYTSHTTDTIGQLDGTPSISANGNTNGIVWVLDRGASQLKAYLASNLATQLWTSGQAPNARDQLNGSVTKFAVPTVADGIVMVGSSGTGASGFLVVYGPPTPPTSAPAAPTNAVASAVAFNQVNITWVDNSSNEDEFDIERSDDAGAHWTQVGAVSANVVAYGDLTTLATTTYSYRVRARNTFNSVSYSAYTNVTTTTTPVAPPLGTGDGAAGAYFNDSGGQHFVGTPALSRVDSTIDFNLGGGSPGSGIGADNFSVRWTGKIQPSYSQTYTFYTQSDDGVRLSINGQTVIDNFNDHGTIENTGTIALSAGAQYAFVMEFYEAGGDAVARLSWSSASTPKQVVPRSQLYSGTAPVAPIGLAATAVSGTQINLAWQDQSANETGFAVLRKAGVGGTYATVATLNPNTTSYSDSGLSPDTKYYYRVQALNFAANSALSNESFATTPVPPLTPTGATASYITQNSLVLNWTDNSTNEDGYRILRGTPGLTFIVIAANLPPNTTNYIDVNLVPGTNYDYHIIAFNVAGYSDFAGISPSTITAAPTGLAASVANGVVSLSWTAPSYNGDSDDVTYTVYRRPASGGSYNLLADSFTATAYDDATASIGQSYQYLVTATDPGGESPASNIIMVTPVAAPTVGALVVNDGTAQRANLLSLTVTFDQPVTLAAGALTLSSTTTQPAGFPTLAWSSSNGGLSYVVTFNGPNTVNGSIADGRYRLNVNANLVHNANNTPLAADASLPFFRLAGDLDGDASVGFSDLAILAQHYGQTGQPLGNGNLNADGPGVVDFNDLVILAQQYGHVLPPEALLAAASVPAATSPPRKRETRGGTLEDL